MPREGVASDLIDSGPNVVVDSKIECHHTIAAVNIVGGKGGRLSGGGVGSTMPSVAVAYSAGL